MPASVPPSSTRRAFLRTSALAAAAAAGPRLWARDPDGRIDAHVHIWTSDTQSYPLAPGFGKEAMAPASFTPEELFAHCRPQGVDRIVLVQMSFYGFDNRYMLEAMERQRGVFSGVAVVDETKADLLETMKHLAARGVRGFRLYAGREKAEAWSGSAGMKSLWTGAADSGLALCLLADPAALPAVHRMCTRFPRTRVVIDHLGRIGMRAPARPDEVNALLRLADFKHTHVKTSAFYAFGAKKAPYDDAAPLIRQLRDAYGASRLMWGSDCPYAVQAGRAYGDSIGLIRDRLDFLSAGDKDRMLRRTAEELFFT